MLSVQSLNDAEASLQIPNQQINIQYFDYNTSDLSIE
jgi:hypothetical protein